MLPRMCLLCPSPAVCTCSVDDEQGGMICGYLCSGHLDDWDCFDNENEVQRVWESFTAATITLPEAR